MNEYKPAFYYHLYRSQEKRNKGTFIGGTVWRRRVIRAGRSIGSDLYTRLYQRNRHRKVEPGPFVDQDICSMYAYQPLPL